MDATSELTILDSEPEAFLFSAWQNVTIIVWLRQATGADVARLTKVTESVVAAYPQGISNIHLIARGAAIPTPDARDGFVALMKTIERQLACVAVVLEGRGVVASALRNAIVGIRMLAPRTCAFRMHGNVEDVVRWLPEEHRTRTGVALDPAALASALAEARVAGQPSGLSKVHVTSFAASMPEAYRQRHNDAEMQAHAAVVHRRGNGLVHLELCLPAAVDGPWLCVVADDRPGLLSLLSAAISAHSLDILGARVYCRTRAGYPPEAVDLFAIRPLKPPYVLVDTGQLLASIKRSIEALLVGEVDVHSLARRARPTPVPSGAPPLSIFFQEAADADLLMVHAPDRPGLLRTITETVFREKLTIAGSHVTTFGHMARDEFQLCELDGTRLGTERKESIVEKLRVALAGLDEASKK